MRIASEAMGGKLDEQTRTVDDVGRARLCARDAARNERRDPLEMRRNEDAPTVQTVN